MRALFLPDYPDREFYTIIPIFMQLGWFATQDPDQQFDFAMCWKDTTWVESHPRLNEIAHHKPVLNLKCLDISKRRVERKFVEVFGRSTFVDPLSYKGRAVCKSDENALGGDIVELPVEAASDKRVYQAFIDATISESSKGDAMVEYRVPFVLGDIPVVYEEIKEKPVDRIKTAKRSVRLCTPDTIFDRDELEKIKAMCRLMGLDFGELDILRSKDDALIYVLDVNKTPGGFGIMNRVNWTPDQRREAIALLAQSLDSGIRQAIARFQ